MDKSIILNILHFYGIDGYKEITEIDSSKDEKDIRLNIIIDKKYVLRMNTNKLEEDYIDSIDRLSLRYIETKIITPRIIKRMDGKYITKYSKYYCYISEYLDYPLLSDEINYDSIHKEVLSSIGKFAKKYSNYDLVKWNSMWSIIDLSPLDNEMDEKEENIILLTNKLESIGLMELKEDILKYNSYLRERIKEVYKELPRCVIQGDLNPSNILVFQDHFYGLIDFNLSGTEVNINAFCNETNEQLEEEDFIHLDAKEYYKKWTLKQEEALNIILKEYELNTLEKNTIYYYRKICQISMYPNVMAYIYYLDKDLNKAIELLNLIIEKL